MNVFVLSCEWEGNFKTLGVYTTLISALEAISHQWCEEGESIEDFGVIDEQRSVVYTNMAIYTIDEHIVEGVEE